VKRNIILIAALVAVVITGFGCTKATKLIGTLKLQAGQAGDVQNTRVELYESSDLTGTPVQYVASKASGSANSSDFEFVDVIEGYYYLLAWKDMDNDGDISDGDIVGINGGTYRPGFGGDRIIVTKGKTTDVGDITMLLYEALEIGATGVRVNGNTETNFSYSFNHDCTITSLTITFPGYSPITDPDAPGARTAGTTYTSNGWNTGGGEMPTGVHTLSFAGTWSGGAFAIDVPVTVN
jgi:hypothetical protein